MATKVKWRAAVFQDLIARAGALGWKEFDEEKLSGIITENADREPDDNGFTPKLQKAYVRAASFSDLGRKRFLNALKNEWPTKGPKKRKNKKPEAKVDLPTHVDPTCVACEGSGLNSNGGQCSPCQENGAQIKKRGKPKKPQKKAPQSKPPKPPKPPSSKPKSKTPPPPPKKRIPPPPPSKSKASPPPPPPKKRIPPPPPKPKGAQKPLGQPQAPPSVGKTYVSEVVTPPRLKAPTFFAVCIQVRLDSSKDESVVAEEMNRYVVEQTGFGANVREAKQLGPQVFDLRVHYAVHITEAFDAVEGHEWVEQAKARPVQDLGVGEPIV